VFVPGDGRVQVQWAGDERAKLREGKSKAAGADVIAALATCWCTRISHRV